MADWSKINDEGNVEDRRSLAPIAFGGMGVTGVAVLLILNLLTGGSAEDVLNQLQNVQVQTQQNVDKSQFEGKDSYEQFVSKVLGSNNKTWKALVEESGKKYREPKLVLFRQATQSGCGTATSQVGPHYCPNDETIYLDETFFNELKSRFGARGGDVAEAYVISHEVGHHVQNVLGIMEEALRQEKSDPEVANKYSVKLELQADCFAGIWNHSIKEANVFEKDEIDEAMDAASSVGDDRIQEKVTGRIDPESWTHGSSSDRKLWFTKGYETGNLASCNTF